MARSAEEPPPERQSSQALLASMNQRQDLQLKLQSTVEGLSVAAITYYIVGLVSYLAKGAQKLGWPLSPETTAAIAIPVVALGVWWSLRRLHHKVFRKHGFECETQGTLFFDVARIIEAKRPKVVLLENVRNLLSHDRGNTFRVIRSVLTEELGYPGSDAGGGGILR